MYPPPPSNVEPKYAAGPNPPPALKKNPPFVEYPVLNRNAGKNGGEGLPSAPLTPQNWPLGTCPKFAFRVTVASPIYPGPDPPFPYTPVELTPRFPPPAGVLMLASRLR